MNKKLVVWLIGVFIFLVGGYWVRQGLGYFDVPSDPSVNPYEAYYGGAVMVLGVVVMLYSRRVKT
jgi:hypothetical protein